MKKILILSAFIMSFFGCAQVEETSFKPEALANLMIGTDHEPITFAEILKQYEGKTVVIDVWANWCPDCIKALPKIRDLQANYPEVTFLFISMDKNYDSWLAGIEKYEVIGEHYLVSDGMKGVFGKSVNLSWIPRYMIVDKTGKIALYNVIEADDAKLIKTLDSLK